MKIAVLGYSGCGKSTLATQLAQKYQLPLLHMDRLRFEANWQMRSDDCVLADLTAFLQQEAWVIDGNYLEFCYQERLAEADQIILLLGSRRQALKGVWQRYIRYRHQVRPSMAAGCEEKLDWEFLTWILFQGRSKARRDAYQAIQQHYPEKTVVIKNAKELAAFYQHA